MIFNNQPECECQCHPEPDVAPLSSPTGRSLRNDFRAHWIFPHRGEVTRDKGRMACLIPEREGRMLRAADSWLPKRGQAPRGIPECARPRRIDDKTRAGPDR